MRPSPPAPLPARPPPPPGEGSGARRERFRLFPHHEEEAVDAPKTLPFVLARLLEDGDSSDLRALFAEVPEPEVAFWLASRGGRQLSTRSRAFWEVVLGTPASPPSPVSSALWPL
jgi:hypothetical protein